MLPHPPSPTPRVSTASTLAPQHGPKAKGQDGGETLARTGQVCAVSGDKFVTGGGEGALTVSNPSNVEVVSIYSKATNTWLDQYLVPGSEVPPPPSDPVPDPPAS
ncbi:hypothetical protein BGZ81_000125 [Podila clonocystis]|nr:hypothetical protein BGZ81_000125 [Podila clonocystis]